MFILVRIMHENMLIIIKMNISMSHYIVHIITFYICISIAYHVIFLIGHIISIINESHFYVSNLYLLK